MGFLKKIRVEPRGLGDSLANATFIMGVDVAVKKTAAFFGIEDCGCEKRRELLNKLVPYSDKEKKS